MVLLAAHRTFWSFLAGNRFFDLVKTLLAFGGSVLLAWRAYVHEETRRRSDRRVEACDELRGAVQVMRPCLAKGDDVPVAMKEELQGAVYRRRADLAQWRLAAAVSNVLLVANNEHVREPANRSASDDYLKAVLDALDRWSGGELTDVPVFPEFAQSKPGGGVESDF